MIKKVHKSINVQFLIVNILLIYKKHLKIFKDCLLQTYYTIDVRSCIDLFIKNRVKTLNFTPILLLLTKSII